MGRKTQNEQTEMFVNTPKKYNVKITYDAFGEEQTTEIKNVTAVDALRLMDMLKGDELHLTYIGKEAKNE